jgi:hypothetical protein
MDSDPVLPPHHLVSDGNQVAEFVVINMDE